MSTNWQTVFFKHTLDFGDYNQEVVFVRARAAGEGNYQVAVIDSAQITVSGVSVYLELGKLKPLAKHELEQVTLGKFNERQKLAEAVEGGCPDSVTAAEEWIK